MENIDQISKDAVREALREKEQQRLQYLLEHNITEVPTIVTKSVNNKDYCPFCHTGKLYKQYDAHIFGYCDSCAARAEISEDNQAISWLYSPKEIPDPNLPTYFIDEFELALEESKPGVFFKFQNRQKTGFQLMTYDKETKTIFCKYTYVDPKHRNKGIGMSLLKVVGEYLTKIGGTYTWTEDETGDSHEYMAKMRDNCKVDFPNVKIKQ